MPDERGQDEIDRRLRELTEEVGKQRIHEPTALERQKAANRARKRTRGRRTKRILSVLAALVVIAGAGTLYYLKHPHALRAAATISPTSRPSLATPVVNDPPANPFAGSPAANWADGADGVVIPSAGSHGPFTAAQVRSAYASTRNLLIAQDLDWPTLRGGFPAAFEHVVPSWYASQFVADLDKTGLNKDGTLRSTRANVTSFAPRTTEFVTQVVKVHGLMTAGTATNSGAEVLRVRFDYLFTYAVEPPGRPYDWMRIVQQQYGYLEFAPSSMGVFASSSFDSFTAGGLCGVTDGYIYPDFPQGLSPSVQPSGPAQDPYSLATPAASSGSTCRPTTGT
jgi:hypothetical protein